MRLSETAGTAKTHNSDNGNIVRWIGEMVHHPLNTSNIALLSDQMLMRAR